MNSLAMLTFMLAGAASSSGIYADEPTVVTLPYGQIRGKELQSPNEKVYYAFQEIPYAAPPVEELRFQPPVAPTPWEGILNTTSNGKICYQSGKNSFWPVLIETEDCLYLNVYTPLQPGDSSQTPLPVLVWIHGGSFRSGSGAIELYDPGLYIDYDIIIVTVNYRLGPFGFLSTEDGVIPGNIGLRDQQFALQWVKENINLFGGDPEKITLSGQSAGAHSVGFQLLNPKNKGLFRAAIQQSGTSLVDRAHQNYARYYAFELGKSLDSNFSSDDSKELLALLQSVPATEIDNNKVTPTIGKEAGIVEGEGLIWLPIIEDPNLEDAFLTGPFHEEIRTGNIVQVPTLLGFNSLEMLLFMLADPPLLERLAKSLDADASNLLRNKFNMTAANQLTAGTGIKQIYTDGTFEDDLGEVVKFHSDEVFTNAITRQAKLQSNYTDVFLYQFSYKGRMGGLNNLEVAGVGGVGHAEDLGYLWNKTRTFVEPPDDPADVVTRNRLLTMWSNFVKYLNPTPVEDPLLDNLNWEKLAPNNLVYLDINNTLQMEVNPKEYIRWERIIDIYAIPPLINY